MFFREKKGLIFITLITLALYWDVFRYHLLYTWDDNIYVIWRVPLLRLAKGDWSALWDLINPMNAWYGNFGEYYPVRDLTYAIDALLAGIDPRVFHLTNLLFHLGVVALVWHLAQRWGLTKKGAFFAALLFALHPLAVEPVVWVSSRKDLTYTFFLLLALNAFWGIVESDESLKTHRQWFFVYLFSILAFLSKGAGSITIFLLLWIVLLEVDSQYWKSYALKLFPLFLFVVLWLIFIIQVGKNNHIISSREFHIAGWPLYQRVFVAVGEPIWAILFYFLPLRLLPDATPDFHLHFWLANSYTWIMLLALILVLIKFFKGELSSRFLLLSGLAAMATLPHSGIIPVYQYRVPRFYYLFLVFFSIFFIYLYERYLEHWKIVPIFFILIFFFTQSYRYKHAWKDDKSLWTYTIRVDPNNMMANKMFANNAMNAGKYRQAKFFFSRALKRHPSATIIRLKIALLNYYIATGTLNIDKVEKEQLLQQAEEIFKQYLHHSSRGAQRKALQGLGFIALAYKKYRLAEELLKASLQYGIKEIDSLLALADLYWKNKRYQKAHHLLNRYRPYFQHVKKYQRWLKEHPLPKK